MAPRCYLPPEPWLIQYVPRNRLRLFPLISGTTWFITLFVLLIYWVALGLPRLPMQKNPYVAFISDIGAFRLRPFFIVGGTITALSFVGTLFAIHFARHDKRMYGHTKGSRTKRILSAITLVSGVLASAGLFFLTIFDTYRFHSAHSILMLLAFVGLLISSICTVIVYLDETVGPTEFKRLRWYCSISCSIVLVEICFGIAFAVMLWTGRWRLAGLFEWILAFLGTFYILAFVGFVAVPQEGESAKHDRERQPLLSEIRSQNE